MGILRDFESRLERAVEGFFTKAFRSGVQPVELAKRILRELDAGKTVGVNEVWVPNRYKILLSPDDAERFTPMKGALQTQLEQVVIEGARERNYGMVAKPEVRLETDENLKRGDFTVEAEITEDTGGPPPATTAQALAGRPRLVVRGAGKESKEFPVDGDRAVIGRLAGSDIQIDDPGASRRHAEIRKEGDEFLIKDLGSTNGTLLNEETVSEETLQDGDRITIGDTVLEFRTG